MKLPPFAAWVADRLLYNNRQPPLNGELAFVSEPWKAILNELAAVPPGDRQVFWTGLLAGRLDAKDIILALAGIKPDQPAPAIGNTRRTAHLGDLAGSQNASRFVWLSWLVKNHFNLLSSDPKIGKTRLALEVARRIYSGEPWPDQQPATFPAGTKTLWVCGDRHQDELRERAAAFGLPPEAVLLNADDDEPYAGWDLDNPDIIEGLRQRALHLN
jgi:hypothetical protein